MSLFFNLIIISQVIHISKYVLYNLNILDFVCNFISRKLKMYKEIRPNDWVIKSNGKILVKHINVM